MVEVLSPRDEADVVAAVEAAISQAAPFDVMGHGSKAGLGRPVSAPRRLETSGLAGVTLYEPEELVMTARAGTALREIRALLVQHGQCLAFDPPDPCALYGGEIAAGTIGGVFATNASGSRRLTAGAARDHLLGFNAVSGRAEVFKSGGRVMKNVTGYDLSKLVTGSFGTLAVLSDVTFKVLPAPETEQSLLVGGLAVEDALRLLRHASGSPHEVSCLAYLPEETVSVGQAAGCAVLRLEGVEVSVVARRKSLIDLFKAWPGAMFETLTGAASANLWQAVRDAAPVAAGGHAVWRVSVAPSAGGEVVAACRAQGLDLASHYFDWAGGLVWLAVEQSIDDAGACIIRRAVDAVGGHALLMRAPAAVRTEVPVFHPQPPSLAALTRRVKEAFDPEGVLSPGRMSRDF